ncbi:MAG TPA: hypothetical protein VIT88_02730 [Pyrinomonadaceae bacterium]
MKLHKLCQFFLLILTLGCLSMWGEVRGQGKQAIVILRSNIADRAVDGCESAQELNYQIIHDARLNAKEEIRLFNSAQSTISREAYERSGKSKLRDLYALKWNHDETLSAVSIAGQSAIMALPENLKPQKNVVQPLSAFYGVMLSGEAREGKQKRKVDLPLRSIWKVYFTSEGAAVNDTLFNHAAEEASVALWEVYLQKTSNYRSTEANTKMRDALIVCSRSDLARFVEGDFRALEKARQKATRAQSVREDDATRQLLTEIRTAQQKVEDSRSKAEQLIKAEKWDEAIDAAEPIRKYLDTWPDLNQMYRHALEQSHEIHLNSGDKQLLSNQLEAALNDCSIARSRLPNSVRALTCVCRARTEIALRDSKKNRQISRPKDAKEILEKQIADSECQAGPSVTSELKLAKCEYAAQLFNEGRQLLGGGAAAPTSARRPRRGTARAAAASGNVNVKAITMQNKKDFREAREKLTLATELCPDDGIRTLLASTNRRLADFCVTEARSALARNNDGTAYVYAQSAQVYTPEDPNVSSLLVEARERFQQRTRVSIGTAFESSIRNEAAGILMSEVNDAVMSSATVAGLAQTGTLDEQQAAAAWRAIQAGRQLDSPTVIFTGTVLAANIDISANPRTVPASYSYENPRWKDADRQHDAVNEQYKNCRKQPGADCSAFANRVAQLRAHRDQYQRTVTERYNYRENVIRMTGGARMSLRFNDSIARGVRGAESLEASDEWQCIERSGVHPQDYGVRDTSCPEPDRRGFFGNIVGKIKREAHLMAVAQLRELPISYYRRAQSASNRQQAVEDYLRFVFLARNKSSSEAEQAKSLIAAYDPELTTDGILR